MMLHRHFERPEIPEAPVKPEEPVKPEKLADTVAEVAEGTDIVPNTAAKTKSRKRKNA